MQRDLEGRVALVTGSSEGIGKATAKLLAQRGAAVALCARGAEKLEAAQKEIAQIGPCEAHQLDVTDSEAFAGLIHDLAKRHGRLDMLVNNALSNTYRPISKLTLAAWRHDFAVNADATFVGTKAALEVMVAAGRGSIVNIASTNGVLAAKNMSSYSASKAALIHFTTCAAMEVADKGVRVNTIIPGMVMTSSTEQFIKVAGKVAELTKEMIPMKRGGEPEELAEAIAFLLSDAASFITGVALPVDGGKAAYLYLPE